MAGDYLGVEISGIGELTKMFEAIGDVGSAQAMGNALTKSVRPIAKLANALAPVGDERKGAGKRLKGSVIVRRRLSRAQMRKRGGKLEEVEVFIGSTRPHAHLVEFGHLVKSRGPNRRGQPPRSGLSHVPAHPFMRPAADALAQQSTRDFFQRIGGEIERVARRFRRQAERGKLSRGARIAFKVPL